MTNFYYSTVSTNYLNDSHKTKKNFGSYLAGLIEGDGYILTREGEKEKTSPSIIITFHEK